jgi:hypothetical protein
VLYTPCGTPCYSSAVGPSGPARRRGDAGTPRRRLFPPLPSPRCPAGPTT